jgi:hypothetical protein
MADLKNTERLSASDCRMQADDCRDQAGKATRSDHRAILERMAETWEQLAADIERRNGR